MDQQLKERLVGATVLVILAVVFIPMLLDDTHDDKNEITGTIIPPKPDSDFSSRIIPLDEDSDNIKTTPAEDAVQEPSAVTRPEPVVKPTPVEDKTPEITAKESTTSDQDVGLSAWVVQLGSFSSETNAQSLNKKLRDAGYPAFVEPIKEKNSVSFRVRVGPELKRSDAQSIRDKIKNTMQLDGIVISYP